MANIKNAVAQFSKSHLGKNGVQYVADIIDNHEQCLSVGVNKLEKYKAKFPKEFLGYRVILKESGIIKAQ